MKTFLIFGLFAILFPFLINAQSQTDPLIIARGKVLMDARDTVWVSLNRVYNDVLHCQPAKNGAVLDSACFILLGGKLNELAIKLSQYVELLESNKDPVWINGSKHLVRLPYSPDIDDVKAVMSKLDKASRDVLYCAQNRGVAGACSNVSVSVSDAVNSTTIVMGWMKK